MECLNLIGRLSHRAPSHDALLLLVTEFCNDIDPRVRREALNALVSTTSLSLSLSLVIYAFYISVGDDERRCGYGRGHIQQGL